MSKAKPAPTRTSRPAQSATVRAAQADNAGTAGTTHHPPARKAELAAAQKAGPRARPRVVEPEGDPRDLGALIRVQATRTGFVDNARRREGDVFDVHEIEFSDKWMIRVDGDTPTQITGPKAALERDHDERLAGKLRTPSTDPLGASTGPRA